MRLKRLLYPVHYLLRMNFRLFNEFAEYSHKISGESLWKLKLNAWLSIWFYNVSPLEYFQYNFPVLGKAERKKWAGNGYMHEYQRQMNPLGAREILRNKIVFHEAYAKLVKHRFYSLKVLKEKPELADFLFKDRAKKWVSKSSTGQCGLGIEIFNLEEITSWEQLLKRMEKKGNDMLEEFIQQHDDLEALAPGGLNTLRVITQINKNAEVDILGVRLRLNVGNFVDNLAAGNLGTAVDVFSGQLCSNGVYSDIRKQEESHHPISKKPIKGFEIPFYKESLDLAIKAALLYPENRSIGWDIAITNTGPDIIEGNHDWCKLLWQLPNNIGLKPTLVNYQHHNY
ncbi:MAG: hexapeptide transferase [Bacteroidetes bacterium]|nr:MAG: hexapeptide transferase [Bacteroidota bacterium]